MNNYQFPADITLIEQMSEPIISALEQIKAEHKKIYQINLVLEEILVNISKYAYPNNKGVVDISYEISDNHKNIKVIIKDKGKEFNPLEKDDPDLSTSAQDRKIGGLGIFLVKNLVDDIRYQRLNNENVLEFIKQL